MQHAKHYVVAHAPKQPRDVGAIVSEPASVDKHRRHGNVLMPIDPALETELSHGGFSKRQFGPDGILFNANRGQGGCPLALQVRSGVPFIHWSAEVVRRGPSPVGTFKLWTNGGGGAQVLQTGLATLSTPLPIDLTGQGEAIIVSGVSRMNGLTDGFMGLGLWGVCTDLAVLWFAVTQAQNQE